MDLNKIKRALAWMWWHDIARLQPLGPISWRYMWPWLPAKPALHRRLWLYTRYRLPLIFWLPLEIIRWLNWRLWLANHNVQRCVAKFGPDAMHRFNVPVDEQQQRLYYWAKTWGIAPVLAYEWSLFRPERDALDFILGGEVQPFQRLMNEQRGASKADYQTIQDKQSLAESLSKIGIPMATTLRASQGDVNDFLLALSETKTVFCKLRSGSRGESAFMAESSAEGLIGQTLAGKKLDSEATVLAAWKTLADKGPVLIQPYLRNHPLLQSLSVEQDSITLRVITRMQNDTPTVWSGFLYVQAPGELKEREYWVLKIDADSGLAFDAFGYWQDLESEIDDSAPLLMLDGQAMPFWPDIVKFSEQAHAELPRLWSIAWDWIVTPDGPVLLEGNAGWDLSPLQELGVDFVKIGCDITAGSPK